MSNTGEVINVLIPDGENYYLQKVLNCFADCKGIRLYVLSDKKIISMRFSKYIDKFIYFPRPADDLEWIAKINELCTLYNIDVLMPVFETRIRTLILHRDHLKYQDKVLIPASLESFDTANRKNRLAVHMQALDIPTPKSIPVADAEELARVLPRLEFPLLLKPTLLTGGGEGIVKFENLQSLEQHVRSREIKFPIVLQQYIVGYDTGCNVLCKDGRVLAYTIQKGFLYGIKPFSPQIGLNIVHEEEVIRIVSRLMESLKWTGLANVDLIYDTRLKRYLILEINPRYWSTVDASVPAGINFPWLYCQTVIGLQFKVPEYNETTFIGLKGMWGYLKKEPAKLFHSNFLWKQTPLKYALHDPLPFIYHFFWRTKNLIVRRFKNKAA